MKKHIKRLLSVLLSLLTVFSCLINGLSVLAADPEIVSVTGTAQNTAVEGTNGYLTSTADGEWYWEYYPSAFEIIITVNYDDGSSFSGTIDEIEAQTGFNCGFYGNVSWTVGENTCSGYVLTNKKLIGFDVICTVTESNIESISAVASKTVIEGTNGYESSRWNSGTQENESYWKYSVDGFDPLYTVTFKNGTTVSGTEYGNLYDYLNGMNIVTFSEQEASPWTVGDNTAYAYLGGKSCEFTCTVVEHPIASISATATKSIMENTHGYDGSYWDGEKGEYISYWRYYTGYCEPIITVNYKDGSAFTGTRDELQQHHNYDYYVSLSSNDTAWEPGEHNVTLSFMGVSCEFICNITENPYESISVEAAKTVEVETNGSLWEYYNAVTCTWKPYWHYDIDAFAPIVTVNCKDGTAFSGTADEIRKLTGFDVYFRSGQDASSPWGIGENTAEAQVGNMTADFVCTIIESDVESIEVEVNPVTVFSEGRYDPNTVFAVLQIAYKDGRTDTAYYTPTYDSFKGYTIRIFNRNNCLGENNTLTFSYRGVTDVVTPELVTTEAFNYDYIEQDGAVYITYYKGSDAEIEIPSEINGLPVAGISHLGYNSTVTAVVLPDSVKYISADAFSGCESLQNIRIGSGVTYIDPATFIYNTELSQIRVNDNNSNYCDVWGVLYSKDKTAIIAYPLGAGDSYTVPSYVTDASAIGRAEYTNINFTFSDGSSAFVTVDGVTYSADMTTVISADDTVSGEYIMPDTVTDIADYAFAGNENITSVVFSDKVTDIAYMSFADCTSLQSVDLPSSLKTISDLAFTGSGITSLTLPESTEKIGNSSFSYNPIASLDLNEGLISIGGGAFADSSIETLSLPDSLEIVGGSAFSYSERLVSLDTGSGVLSIERHAFYYCVSLSSVDLSGGTKYIGTNAFENCISLTELIIPQNVKSMGEGAFKNGSSLKKLTVEADLTQIADGAFVGCPIEDLNINGNIEEIGMHAFSGADIDKLTVTDTVTEIAYGAFYGCENLIEVTAPDKTIKISSYAFDRTPWYESQSDGLIYIGKILYDCKGDFEYCDTLTFDKPTLSIGDYAFDGLISDTAAGLTELILPEGLEHIGKGAFRNCTAISKVYIPESVKTIDYNAFAGCTGITEFVIDGGNPYLICENGLVMSADRTKLFFCLSTVSGDIRIPSSVKEIYGFAFAGCYEVSSVRIPSSVTSIQGYAIGYSHSGVEGRDRIEDIINGAQSYELNYISGQVIKVICTEDSVAYNYAAEWLLPIETMVDCNHKYTEAEVAPTCTKVGYTLHTCSVCGDTYTSNTVAALGHSNSDGYTIDKYPTCLECGQMSLHCAACGEITDITVIQPNGHTAGSYETVKSPTCTTDGIMNEYCAICGTFIREVKIPAAHMFSLWSWKIAPSGSSNGVKTRVCSDCGAVETVMASALDNKGDLNGDGAVNVKDLVYMKKVAAQQRDYVTEADMSGDNICTAYDIVLLRKYILGIR